MSRGAISARLDDKTVEWKEKISDVDFNTPLPGQPASCGRDRLLALNNSWEKLRRSSLSWLMKCFTKTSGLAPGRISGGMVLLSFWHDGR